jgi:hypothetical protein
MNKYFVKNTKDMPAILDLVKENGGDILMSLDMGMCRGMVVECTPETAEALELKPYTGGII